MTKRSAVLWSLLDEQSHLAGEIRRRAKQMTAGILELVAYGRGTIVKIKSDAKILSAINKAQDLLEDLRVFISTRARGEK